MQARRVIAKSLIIAEEVVDAKAVMLAASERVGPRQSNRPRVQRLEHQLHRWIARYGINSRRVHRICNLCHHQQRQSSMPRPAGAV